MGLIIKSQLLLVLSLSATNSFGAQVQQWFGEAQKPGAHTIQVAKDYYNKKYAFDTTKPCVENREEKIRCFQPGTVVTCSSYTEIPATNLKNVRYQFCNVSHFQPKGENKRPVSADRKITMVTGVWAPNEGKIEFTPRALSNRFFEVGLDGKPLPLPKPIDETPVAPKPKPKPKPENSDSEAGVADCANCEPPLGPTARAGKQGVEIAVAAPKTFKETVGAAFASKVKRIIYSPACYGFIKANGELGDWGKQLVSNFKRVCHECFFGEDAVNVSALCPKFKDFTQEQQEYFWAWFGAAAAQPESSCKPNASAPGVNGRAVGLLQLELDAHLRRPGKRGPECRTSGSVSNTSFQFACAASIIRDTRWADGKPLWGSNGKNDQYWEKLKHTSGRISKYISSFPGCFPPPKPKAGAK